MRGFCAWLTCLLMEFWVRMSLGSNSIFFVYIAYFGPRHVHVLGCRLTSHNTVPKCVVLSHFDLFMDKVSCAILLVSLIPTLHIIAF